MEDLDFTKPSQSEIYDPDTVRAFFNTGGSSESFAQGETIFGEQPQLGSGFHADAKMYLLVEGSVRLIIGKNVIDTLRPGEIFGEMAAISEMPRSATAVAKSACRVLTMGMSQFRAALSATPEFALMLMGIVINRLRLTNARLSMMQALPTAERKEGRIFEAAFLADLQREASADALVHCKSGKSVMVAGEVGNHMYVVLDGCVVISLQNKVVGRVTAGGVFGEMALIDQSPRAANAAAETDCSLLRISRADFLNMVRNKPSFGVALLKTLADRLRFMTSQMASR